MAEDPCLRLCLGVLRRPAPGPEAAERRLRQLPEGFLAYLGWQRVDQLWLRAILDLGLEPRLPAELAAGLKHARRAAAVSAMLQQEAARHAATALASAGVHHLFFKGFHLGEELYGDAVLRPAADVDLLVAQSDRDRALAVLAARGFSPAPEEGQPPYQLTLARHGAALDLHWHLLPVGRSRTPLTARVLESRRERDGFGFPGVEEALVLMLLLPALSDHVTARLIHAVDLDRWLRLHAGDLDWRKALELLSGSGLATAAWAMLRWTRSLFDTPLPESFEEAIAPGPLRRRYLRQWLARDPAGLYHRFPLLVRGGFSLFLLDRPSDAARVVAAALGARATMTADPHPEPFLEGEGASSRTADESPPAP